ncbi:hypothetical protein [Anabaena sp. PCC 7108]|nr:hypothetical protein [Anabaena sp. PCC 7108]
MIKVSDAYGERCLWRAIAKTAASVHTPVVAMPNGNVQGSQVLICN